MQEYIKFKCIEINQPIGTFYIGSIEAKDLWDISYADVRRIEERDVERLVGIQRPLVNSRVKEIKQYIGNIDATFPTSIILAIDSEDAEYDDNKGIMKIKNDKDVAKIIDGQHRIAGFEDYSGDFHLNVTIFIDMDIEDQAMVFATINLKQTKVNKSLVYDLYEYAKKRSPQKTCHNIAKLLNSKDDSPFKDKIKILGTATGKPYETLTQATFVEQLINYISSDPNKDRDILKRGKKLDKELVDVDSKLIYRQMFNDERDAEIAKILYLYFQTISEKWHDAWYATEKNIILSRTAGFKAFMKFLRNITIYLNKQGELIKKNEFEKIINKINLKDTDFSTDKYNPGGKGEADLYKDLLRLSNIQSSR
jgi:DGQHR domain-containing protein